jgi:hypothetical protein
MVAAGLIEVAGRLVERNPKTNGKGESCDAYESHHDEALAACHGLVPWACSRRDQRSDSRVMRPASHQIRQATKAPT